MKLKHTQEWYVKMHNALAAIILIGGGIAFFIICGLLENI